MHGNFAWNELVTGDVERAKEFFGQVLGWTFEEFPLPDGKYWVAKVGDEFVAGLCHFDVGSLPSRAAGWLPFVQVDDVDRRIELARQGGAEVIEEAHDVPNVGRVGVIKDPTGAPLGFLTGE